MLISLHSPKTAGTSFKEILKENFKSGFYSDYKDKPISKNLIQRIDEANTFDRKFSNYLKYWYKLKGIQCVHGHFLPYKYKSLAKNENNIFITWLRDPMSRLESHYLYWHRTYSKDAYLAPHHRKVIEEGWTFEEFCLSNLVRNIYSQYLWNFPIERFNFIGITEYFEEDLEFFSRKYLNIKKIQIPQINKNTDKKGSLLSDPDLIKKIKEFHKDDYDLYNYALSKRLTFAQL